MITLSQLTKVCDLLNKGGVKYVLVGGWAIFIHGYERATKDIDILIDPDAENVKRLKDALKGEMPEACAELALDDVEKNIVVRMGSDRIIIDLMKKIGEVDYEKAGKHVVLEEINGIKIRVADLETLIETKKGVRDTDKRDYMFLVGKRDYLSHKKSRGSS